MLSAIFIYLLLEQCIKCNIRFVALGTAYKFFPLSCEVLLLVRQICAKFYKNCGVYGKSTKFGTMIVYDIVNNMGYEPHRDLSNNSKYSRFNFLHQDSRGEDATNYS